MKLSTKDSTCQFSMNEAPEKVKILLFYHPHMSAAAHAIQRDHPQNVALGHVEWAEFPDGWPKLFIDPHDLKLSSKVAHTCYLGSFTSPHTVFEEIAVIHSIARARCKSFRIVVPYFPTGTMDRVDTYGEVATSKTLARMLSTTPLTMSGPPTVTIYDIHALQEEFYFGDSIQIEMKSAVFLLRQILVNLAESNIAIAFPDAGAWKRFHTKFPEYPDIVCSKIREGKTRIVKVQEGDPTGMHCVIVDDLVQSGGTLIECAKALREAGATKISCWVTHAVFPNDSWRRFVDNELIANFWTTDTVSTTTSKISDHRPFQVVSISSLLSHLLIQEVEG